MSIEGFAFDSRRQLFHGFQFPAGGCTIEDFVKRNADWAVRNVIALANCVRIDIQIRHAFAFRNEVDREKFCKPLRVAGVAVIGEKISNVFTYESPKHSYILPRSCTERAHSTTRRVFAAY